METLFWSMPLISVILSVWFHTICHWSVIFPSISMSTRVWQTQFEQNVHFYPQVCGHWAVLSLLALNFPLSNSFRDSHPGRSYFELFEKITRGDIWLLSFVLNNNGFSEKSELWFDVYRQIVKLFGVEFFQWLDSFDPIFHVLMARNKTSVHFYHLLLTMFWSLSSGLTVAINRIVGTKLSIVVIIIL